MNLAPVVRPVRIVWRRLTSMRTALILLFLLAVAAVPGSLLPQRPLNPGKTSSYIKDHGSWGSFLDSIGMFDVFGSVWFAAIYLLLFISLVGCLIPRIRVHARAVARKPLPAPRNLGRLPESGEFDVPGGASAYAERARAALGRRWRVVQRTEPSGAVTLSAEKGYSRETGNLIFHVALLASLILIAVGRLYTYEGSVIVKQGQGFCNNVGIYDTWKPGRFAAEGKVKPAPFCVDQLTRFTATYLKDGEASQFRADIRYSPTQDAAERHATITVNHPLRLEGDRLYLTGHGYAPKVTVQLPGHAPVTQTNPFIPTNATTFYSEGAFRIFGAAGGGRDVGISGFFAPTPYDTGNGIISSSSPRVDNPVLGIIAYTGTLDATGAPQSVYSLDTTHLKQAGAANLREGQTKTFPNGMKVTFDGWVPYANFQVSHDPAQGYLLWSALAMVLGLAASLGVRRRRLWLRIAPASDGSDAGPTVVTVGGLARSDSGNFTTEFAGLLARLREAGTSPDEPSGPIAADRSSDVIGAGRDQ